MMKVVGIGLLSIVGIGSNGCPTIHTSSRGRIFLLGEVGRGLGTSGEVVVVGATNVEGPLIIELEIQLLADIVAMETRRHRTSSEPQHLSAVLIESLIAVHLPVICLMVGIGGVGRKFAGGEVHGDIFVQTAVIHHLGGGRCRNGFLAVVCNDVDDTRNSIAAVECRCRPAKDFNTAYISQRDTAPAVITTDAFSVLKNNDIVIANAVEVHKGSHSTGVRSDMGGQPC